MKNNEGTDWNKPVEVLPSQVLWEGKVKFNFQKGIAYLKSLTDSERAQLLKFDPSKPYISEADQWLL